MSSSPAPSSTPSRATLCHSQSMIHNSLSCLRDHCYRVVDWWWRATIRSCTVLYCTVLYMLLLLKGNDDDDDDDDRLACWTVDLVTFLSPATSFIIILLCAITAALHWCMARQGKARQSKHSQRTLTGTATVFNRRISSCCWSGSSWWRRSFDHQRQRRFATLPLKNNAV